MVKDAAVSSYTDVHVYLPLLLHTCGLFTNIIFSLIIGASSDATSSPVVLCVSNLSSSVFIGILGTQIPDDWDQQWCQRFISLLSTSRAYTHACIIKLMRCKKRAMLV